MEPKLSELITTEIKQLERDVYGYLSFGVELAQTDAAGRQLLMEDAPIIPETFLLLRKLKMFAGNGQIPFLIEGGYMDQPYCTMLALEACIEGERRFEESLKQGNITNAVQPKGLDA